MSFRLGNFDTFAEYIYLYVHGTVIWSLFGKLLISIHLLVHDLHFNRSISTH